MGNLIDYYSFLWKAFEEVLKKENKYETVEFVILKLETLFALLWVL